MCRFQYRQLYADAAVFFSEAFAAQPKFASDLRNGNRYNAACAAALAGSGQVKDAAKLDAKEYARLRGQALAWLQAELNAWASMLEKDPNKVSPVVRGKLQYWLADPDFNGVRGTEALAKLPEGERQEWRKLWEDVEALAKHAGKSK